jgi:Zn-dependent protease
MFKAIPAAIIGLTLHEYAHALAAFKLGDATAKNEGRLSINPIRHIDIFGFILIIIAGFGWAKPVSFNPANFKKRNRDEIMVSLAGPFANAVIGFLFILIAKLVYYIPYFNSTDNGVGAVNTIVYWGVINFGLFIFNLLPIPPLDGSHVYLTYMNELNENLTRSLYRIGTWALLAIVVIQNSAKLQIIPINNIVSALTKLVMHLLKFD